MYKRILVPIDGSDTAQRGLAEAIELSRAEGARLRLIHVLDELALAAPGATRATFDRLLAELRDYGASILAEAERQARSAGVEVDAKLVDGSGGSAGECIIREANAWPADLIVCGTHGRRGLARMVLGSDSEYVARHSSVPVLLVRARGAESK